MYPCSKKWALSPSLGVFCPRPFLSAQGFFPALKARAFFFFPIIQFLLHSPHLERRGCRTILDLQFSGILWFPILSKNSVISVNSIVSPSATQGASAPLLVFRCSVLYAVFAFHFYIWLTAIFFTLWKSYPVCSGLSGDTCCLSSSLSSCFLSIHLFLKFSPWLSYQVGLQPPNPARFTCWNSVSHVRGNNLIALNMKEVQILLHGMEFWLWLSS